MNDSSPRKTISAPAPYWDVLETVIGEGHARNLSEAFRYVCDEFLRLRRDRELGDAAGALSDAEWLTEAGLGDDEAQPVGTRWSSLTADR